MASRLPMFPLGTVLVPGGVLPLHVFEPRYQRLVADCLAAPVPSFGVVLIDRGHEVGGGDVRRTIATVAVIDQVAELGGGRFALVTHGERRVRIARWLPDDPYPCAEVEEFPEEGPIDGLEQARRDAVRALRTVLALASELGVDGVADPEHVSADPVVASYHLSALAPFGPDDRYRLLSAPGPAARYELLSELLAGTESVLRFRLLGSLDDDDVDPDRGV
jgi:Lon protease-like protein